MTSPNEPAGEHELSVLSNPAYGSSHSHRQSTPAISDTTRYTATNGETIILTRFSQRDSPIDLELGPHENAREQTGGPVRGIIDVAWDPTKRWRKYWKIGHFIEHTPFRYLEFLILCWELHAYLTREDPDGEEAIRASTRTRRIIFIVIPLVVYFGIGVFDYCRHLRLPSNISRVWRSRATTRPENAREQDTGSSTATAYQQQPVSHDSNRDVQNDNRGNVRRRLPRERPLAQVPEEKPPLHKAVISGDENKVKHLLEQGIKPDATDSYGRTALLIAAMHGDKPMVELLVERKDVDVDKKDYGGQTPLLVAAEQGQEQIFELLVERKDVNADTKDCFGRTPLSLAARYGHKQIVELLVEREDVNADTKEDGDGRTPLLVAAMYGHKQIVQLLVEREGVDLHTQDNNGDTPLSSAKRRGYGEIFKILEDKGAVMNAKKQL